MTREQTIIHAGIDLFNEKGLSFSMDDIARRLSISKKTIYVCFPSKEELLLAMTDEVFHQIYLEKDRVLMADLPIPEKLEKAMIAMPQSYLNAKYDQLAPLTRKYPRVGERVMQYLRGNWEPVLALYRQGVREGSMRQVDVRMLQIAFTATIESLLTGRLPKDQTYIEALQSLIDILINGMKERADDRPE